MSSDDASQAWDPYTATFGAYVIPRSSYSLSVKRILVLGGGFAGLWSAVGAARKLDELGCGPEAVQVTLVNRDGFHNIRVRNYESDPGPGPP